MAIREIKLEVLEREFQLAGYNIFGSYSPPVVERKDGFSIRILKSQNTNFNTGNTTTNWDYFETDNEGLILKSPRGYAKDFNKKIKITDLKKRAKEFKKKS